MAAAGDPQLTPRGEVRCHALDKAFGTGARRRVALQHADLDVNPGSLTALLGPSGCGKTTLLRIVAGFERPDSGSVEVSGRLVASPTTFEKPERRRVGTVPQEGALFPHLSVADNVAFGVARDERRQRVAECLELVDLVGFERARPGDLSGGQQQRVAVARAIAPRPEVLLLDEPFSALDAGLRAEVRNDIADVLRHAKITALLVTHDQDEALSMADELAVMFDGTIVQTGTPGDVYRQPSSLDVARFIGEMTEVPAEAFGETAQSPLGRIRLAAPQHGAVQLAVRPEQVLLSEGHGGVVERVTYYGHDALVGVVLPDGSQLSARVLAGDVLPPGTPVSVEVRDLVLAYPRGECGTPG
jgi:iron(III) transport system ATP-binding protein